MRFDLTDLRLFQQVVEAGTITHGAERMHLAVAAASVGSLESIETAATLSEQNAANLLQNKTSDQWAFFQAKSIKKNSYEIAAKQGGQFAEEFNSQARKNEEESHAIRAVAENLERQVAARLHEAERHEQRHHILTTAVTLLALAKT